MFKQTRFKTETRKLNLEERCMKTTRKVALLLSIVMALSLIAGCAKTAKSARLKVEGKTVKMDSIMTIDGEAVSLDLYRYYYYIIKNNYDQGDESYWTENADAQQKLKDDVLNNLKSVVAIKTLAEANGVALTDDDMQTVEDQVDATIDQLGGYSAYVEALEAQYMTDEVYRQLMENDLRSNALYAKLYGKGGEYELSESEMKEIIASDYIRAKHVLIAKTTENAAEIEEEVRQKAAAGEDFDELIAEYNEDPGMTNSPDGYYFTDGQMVSEFEQAAKALDEDGGISGVVETDYGYHIIQRLPLDMDYVDENISDLLTSHQQFRYNQFISESMEDQEISFNEYYDRVSFETLS